LHGIAWTHTQEESKHLQVKSRAKAWREHGTWAKRDRRCRPRRV